jgi:hypothetical protein
MSFKTITLFCIVALACIVLMTTSCSTYSVYSQPTVTKAGPPTHAPAYGYRRKQVSGMELVYDSGLGLYVVVGLPDHYYNDGYFYRLRGGLWEISQKPDIGWKVVSESSLPQGLRGKVKVKANGNGNHNGNEKSNGNGRGRAQAKHKKDVASIGRPF